MAQQRNHQPERGGWEYRYFLPLSPERTAQLRPGGDKYWLRGNKPREDCYFPCSDDRGVKIRDGDGDRLEVKTRRQSTEIGVGVGNWGSVEFWTKEIIEVGPAFVEKHRESWRLFNPELLTQRLEIDGKQMWRDYADCRSPGVRVQMAKARTVTNYGESTDVLLKAFVDGHQGAVLQEAYCSICVEIGIPEKVEMRLMDDPSLQPPAGAFIGGYPALVKRCAERALAAFEPRDEDEGSCYETCDELEEEEEVEDKPLFKPKPGRSIDEIRAEEAAADIPYGFRTKPKFTTLELEHSSIRRLRNLAEESGIDISDCVEKGHLVEKLRHLASSDHAFY